MIARCLDNDPDNRPSAREMVDFLMDLPAHLSVQGSCDNGSRDFSGAAARPASRSRALLIWSRYFTRLVFSSQLILP
jgi:hypothetical protein